MTRVADITTAVKRYRNEPTVDPFISSGDVLAWINQCQGVLASAGLWRYSVKADIEGETNSLVISELTTDELESGTCIAVESIRWVYDGANYPLTPITTEARYQSLLANRPTGGVLGAYYIKTGTIYWFPVPEDDCNEGVEIFGVWRPPNLTGLPGGDAPYSDAAFDDAYVFYCVAQAWLKDHTAEGYFQNYQNFMGLWEAERYKILGNSQSPAPRIKPYRK